MGTPPLSSDDIRAATQAHRELGPEYDDAVVESFMAKVEKVIEARVDARLAASSPARRSKLDPATLARRRLTLKYMAVGSAAVAIPFSFVVMWAHGNTGGYPVGDWTGTVVSLVVMWVLIAGVYVACALPLRSSRHDRDEG